MLGKLEIVDTFLDGSCRLMIKTGTDPHLNKLVGENVDFFVKKHRKRRSLDANGYYWTLVTQLAESIGSSKSRVHNILLRRYGQHFLIDEKPVYAVLPDTDEAAKTAEEDESVHLKPTSQVKSGKDGRMYRTYVLMRGSHDYDTKEMSVLLDGTISECKEAGIETLTPEQLRRMTGYEQKKQGL